ncbi:hypothetical protein C8F04DRAFT_1386933 [Mycena alexandri]|uniref:Uncharacterized protein n=1 Tax=Mycena alexandri TaxID=1745969 RepID=A0AAD6TJH1_9AGAR|nr:hypothetical protein C8F04DRAFT_1386933 [Mycena alexandri]
MATMHPTLPTSPSALKHMEKELVKEGKTEANQVKHTLKDVEATEKAAAKAQKSVNKAEKQNAKLSKQEETAAKALNKATHRHESAVTELTSSDRDVKLKHQHDIKVQSELETKKAQAEKLANTQKMHDEAREAKLSEVREAAAKAAAH